jgi:hypothetical protein
VNTRKCGGFSPKFTEPAGFDLVDSGRLDLDPLDLDPTAAAVRGAVARSGPLVSGTALGVPFNNRGIPT